MTNFDAAKAMFSHADTNNDASIDPNEFRTWIGSSSSSSYEGSNLAFGDNVAQTTYSSQSGFECSDGLANAGGSSSEVVQVGSTALESSSAQQITQYPSKNSIFIDPNPQIIRRAATGGVMTYQQRITVKFLQPPAVPPPGPLIVREIRPSQPPPPLPLIVRQRAPALPQPPPLILRERPPMLPASVPSQTVIRRLDALPVPPRSVIIERLPPLPAKPRDIIIERWVPYGAQTKRRTIIQRAAAVKQYAKPRNLIIVHDAAQARVVRQFQRLGVTQEDPQAYLGRYRETLLDSSTLIQQARAVGVVEDISPPAVALTTTQFRASAGDISGLEGVQNLGGTYSSQSFSSSSSSGFGAEEGLVNGAHFSSTTTKLDQDNL